MTPLKLKAVHMDFEGMLKDANEKAREDIKLRIWRYLSENTDMSAETWEEAEKLLVEEGVFKKGGLMDARDVIKEEGRLEGEQAGLQKGQQKERQQIVLNMLKSKLDIPFISEVTGLSEKEIKKLKNGS